MMRTSGTEPSQAKNESRIHSEQGPLKGLKVLELNAIGPVPFAAGLLADLGADVLRIEGPSGPLDVGDEDLAVHLRGRSSVTLDLRDESGLSVARELISAADVVLEGFRPGVMERLGLDPEVLISEDPRLIVGRMTGWGQQGPLAGRAGHDIDYIAAAGALRAFGRAGEAPVPPVNLVGDFGGGAMFLLVGVLAALWERGQSGRGQIIDAAMVDGTAYLMMLVQSLAGQGLWDSANPGTNLLDTGAPFYDVYQCSDGQYLAVGCLEPKFYAEFADGIKLDADAPEQYDRDQWPELRRLITERIRSKTRDEWEGIFVDTDACVTGVRTCEEAAEHPHLAARGTYLSESPLQAAPAPRFSRTPGRAIPRRDKVHGAAALTGWGIDEELAQKVVGDGDD